MASERPETDDQAPADGRQVLAGDRQSQADDDQAQASESQAQASDDQVQASEGQECMPCGGRGSLISKLGGQESTVQCPWCEGSGQRRTGVDAQAGWLSERGGEASEDASR